MIRKESSERPPQPAAPLKGQPAIKGWTYWFSWAAAVLMVLWFVTVVLHRFGIDVSTVLANTETTVQLETNQPNNNLPATGLPSYTAGGSQTYLARSADLHTIIPNRPRTKPQDYVVEAGDSVFGIAQQFKLKPETVLWANFKLLNDNPNMLTTGQDLVIPTTDGVLYEVKNGDTLESVAKKYQAKPEDIVSWPGNNIDIAEPVLVAGQTIMIPNGIREMRSWVVPTIWRANSGANKTIDAACNTSSNVYGSGYFMWPADNHSISGNDFWSGHLGIDIAAGMGAPIYAADSGVVVYAAGIGGGYGNMVMIDHGNGFHTLYAHLSQILVTCGEGVSKGQVIAYAGSTGNSTGSHLHFEIRYFGAFVNPHDYVR